MVSSVGFGEKGIWGTPVGLPRSSHQVAGFRDLVQNVVCRVCHLRFARFIVSGSTWGIIN